MKRKITCAALFLLASTYLLFACKKDHSEQPSTVSFEGTYTTTNEVLNPPPMLKQRITGIGQSTRLDMIKFVAVSTLNLTTPPPFRLAAFDTTYTADGDAFYTTATGTSTPNADGTSTVEMTHTINGGSGKFKNATGSFTGLTIVTASNPTNTITLKGDIRY